MVQERNSPTRPWSAPGKASATRPFRMSICSKASEIGSITTCWAKETPNTNITKSQGRNTPGLAAGAAAGGVSTEGAGTEAGVVIGLAAEDFKGVVDGKQQILQRLRDVGQAGGDEHITHGGALGIGLDQARTVELSHSPARGVVLHG